MQLFLNGMEARVRCAELQQAIPIRPTQFEQFASPWATSKTSQKEEMTPPAT